MPAAAHGGGPFDRLGHHEVHGRHLLVVLGLGLVLVNIMQPGVGLNLELPPATAASASASVTPKAAGTDSKGSGW